MRMSPTPSTPMTGFRLGSAGLLVPNTCQNARTRFVVPAESDKVLRRFIKDFLAVTDLGVTFRCQVPTCPDPRIERLTQDDGGFVLRCGCRDRVCAPLAAVPRGRLWQKR